MQLECYRVIRSYPHRHVYRVIESKHMKEIQTTLRHFLHLWLCPFSVCLYFWVLQHILLIGKVFKCIWPWPCLRIRGRSIDSFESEIGIISLNQFPAFLSILPARSTCSVKSGSYLGCSSTSDLGENFTIKEGDYIVKWTSKTKAVDYFGIL